MRPFVLAAVAALALAAAPAAVAKEIKKAQVCGPDSCATVDDEEARMALINGGPPRRPPAAAPYYDVRVTMAEGDESHTWGFAVVPGQDAARADDGTWMVMPPEVSAVVEKYAGDQKPFPASELIGAAPPADPKPQPAPADDGSPLWPEGVLIALALAAGGVFLVRAARGSRRFGPASS